MYFFFKEYENDSNLIKYYAALKERHSLPRYRRRKDIVYRYLPLLGDLPQLVRSSIRLLHRSPTFTPPLDHIRLAVMVQDRIRAWVDQVGVDVSTGMIQERALQAKAENEHLFAGMVSAATAHGVTVKIVIPPFADLFNERLDKRFVAIEYEGYLKDLADRYGLKFYNYRQDARFSSHYELFRNVDCLNSLGATKFVEIVMKEVINNDDTY